VTAASASGDPASCGHPNPVWFTDSRLWNEVMNGGDQDAEAGGIICPLCFIDRAEDYFDGSRWTIKSWRLVPELARPRVMDTAEVPDGAL
jgi:hypothetical protein